MFSGCQRDGGTTVTTARQTDRISRLGRALLICGIISPAVYVATDIIAAALYPGYSFTDQAVSELFAIGSSTSRLVVPLFSLSSTLLAVFSLGVWLSSGSNRWLRVMAFMIAGNAVNSLILWNLFPMHMRGVQPTFTDTMHYILAINPFVLASIVLGVAAFRGWFRSYSIATIVLLVLPAVFSFVSAAQIFGNQPTPWLGATERMAQYAHLLWHSVLAISLLRNSGVIKEGSR